MANARLLAEPNIGRLVAEPGELREAEVMAELDSIHGLGERMPGLVWTIDARGVTGSGNNENCIAGDPHFAAPAQGGAT
jgi:hypothetical protein